MHTPQTHISAILLAKISTPSRRLHHSLQMLLPTPSRLSRRPLCPLFQHPQPKLNRPQLSQRRVLPVRLSPPFPFSLRAQRPHESPTVIPRFLILPECQKEPRPQTVTQPSLLLALLLNLSASLFQHPFLLPPNPGPISSEPTRLLPLQPLGLLRV